MSELRVLKITKDVDSSSFIEDAWDINKTEKGAGAGSEGLKYCV